MMLLGQRILIQILATVLKVAVGVLRFLAPAGRLVALALGPIGGLLLGIALPLYGAAVSLKRTGSRLLGPLEQRSVLVLHLFTRRYFFHLTLIGLSLIVVTTNLNAYEVKRDELQYSNVFINLLSGDELGEIEEVRPPAKAAVRRYLESGVLERTPGRDPSAEADLTPGTIAGGSAVVKPVRLPGVELAGSSEAARTEMITYTVQEGDTVWGLAVRFNISVNTILWENNLTAYSIIRPGQTLRILPVSGLRHRVARGENINKIASRYGVEVDAIIEANRLASADDINVGDQLIIPGARKATVSPVYALRRPGAAPAELRTGRLIWPASCRRITQYFYWRHSGVDIACPHGSAIYAAAAGRVIRAQGGWNGGYGILVIIQHADGSQTLYGHNSKLYVRVGEEVRAGQAIAAIGSTGRSTGPHVHFEIRLGGYRRNPLNYIR